MIRGNEVFSNWRPRAHFQLLDGKIGKIIASLFFYQISGHLFPLGLINQHGPALPHGVLW